MVERQIKQFDIKSSFAFCATLLIICCMFFLRDNAGIAISQSMLLIVFSVGILFFRKCDFAALGVCIPLFCNGIQTMALIFIALIIYCVKFGFRFIRLAVVILFILMLIELSHIMDQPFDFLQYGRYFASFIFMGFILGDMKDSNNSNIQFILKSYVLVYCFTMIDILFQFTNRYGSVNAFVTAGIRLGNSTIDLEGTFNTLYNNANMIGLYSVLAIATCICLILQKKSRWKILWFVAAFFAVYCGLTSGSRTFLASFLMLLIVALWAVFEDRTIKTSTKMLLITASVAIGVIAAQTVFSSSIDNLMLRFNSTESTDERNTLLSFYNKYILEHPERWFTGIGLQSVMQKTGGISVPHNGIQEIVVCCGFIGLGLIFRLFGYIFNSAKVCRFGKRVSLKNVLIFVAFIIFIQFIQFVRLPEVYLLVILAAYGLGYDFSEDEVK